MYGLQTLNSLNRKNAEAAAILAKHAAKPTEQASHKPTMFAQTAKINQILEGAKG